MCDEAPRRRDEAPRRRDEAPRRRDEAPPFAFDPLSFVFRLTSFVFRLLSIAPQELDPRTGYDLWAATYDADQSGNPVLAAERMSVEPRLPSLTGQVVLDLACGTGHYALRAARAGARLVVGVDLSAAMLRQARRKSEGLPVALVQADQAHVPLIDGSLQVVVHALGAGYAPNLSAVASEMGRLLRPDGVAFVSDLHPEGLRRGWRRTFSFSVHGRTRREAILQSYLHRMEDYRTAFDQAGLLIVQAAQPRIGAALRSLFVAADALPRYERYRDYPLLVVFELCRKTPSTLADSRHDAD
jgi:ubiquinone/menaquinone biosynthesis C-methylase UbiE